MSENVYDWSPAELQAAFEAYQAAPDTATAGELREVISGALAEVRRKQRTFWGVYKNADMTEGRGATYLARLFTSEERAEAWRRTQPDYPNWPMHQVRPVVVDLEALDSPDGWGVRP